MVEQMAEIVTAKELGRPGSYKYIWHACIDCGKERLVQWTKGKPRNLRCYTCSNAGKNNPKWRGGQFIGDGYVRIYKPDHPAAVKNYVKRAILVLEEKLGRHLRDGYDSHHKNGIKDDDRPENLEEKEHGKHTTIHNKGRQS